MYGEDLGINQPFPFCFCIKVLDPVGFKAAISFSNFAPRFWKNKIKSPLNRSSIFQYSSSGVMIRSVDLIVVSDQMVGSNSAYKGSCRTRQTSKSHPHVAYRCATRFIIPSPIHFSPRSPCRVPSVCHPPASFTRSHPARGRCSTLLKRLETFRQ